MKIIGVPGGGYSTTPVLDYFREKGIGMSEQTKVVVPEGMLAAVLAADPCVAGHEGVAKHHIETALLWQKKHSRVPTPEEAMDLVDKAPYPDLKNSISWAMGEWVRRMYDTPEFTPDEFTKVFMFGTVLERPATAADEPISEREKQYGVRETVTCVRAEDYSRLLKAYRELAADATSTVDSK